MCICLYIYVYTMRNDNNSHSTLSSSLTIPARIQNSANVNYVAHECFLYLCCDKKQRSFLANARILSHVQNHFIEPSVATLCWNQRFLLFENKNKRYVYNAMRKMIYTGSDIKGQTNTFSTLLLAWMLKRNYLTILDDFQ